MFKFINKAEEAFYSSIFIKETKPRYNRLGDKVLLHYTQIQNNILLNLFQKYNQ